MRLLRREMKEINSKELIKKVYRYQRTVANYLNQLIARLSSKEQITLFVGFCICFTFYLLFLIINALSF
jgi:hypothetical protein